MGEINLDDLKKKMQGSTRRNSHEAKEREEKKKKKQDTYVPEGSRGRESSLLGKLACKVTRHS